MRLSSDPLVPDPYGWVPLPQSGYRVACKNIPRPCKSIAHVQLSTSNLRDIPSTLQPSTCALPHHPREQSSGRLAVFFFHLAKHSSRLSASPDTSLEPVQLAIPNSCV